jgi:excisionase family DNA binding protein
VRRESVTAVTSASQTCGIVGIEDTARFHPSQGIPPVRTALVTPVLQGAGRQPAGEATAKVTGRETLLTVRDAARRLGVSTATVYALCDAGTLAHVRVANAIRVAPGDLAAFVRAHRRGARQLRPRGVAVREEKANG